MSHKLVSLYIGEGEYYTRTDADNALAEKDEEIAQLKADYSAKVEELCIEKTNVDTLEQAWKQSQRALWLARLRALRGFSVLTYFQVLRVKGKESNMDFDEMAYRITLACVKCRAKAEEYKRKLNSLKF